MLVAKFEPFSVAGSEPCSGAVAAIAGSSIYCEWSPSRAMAVNYRAVVRSIGSSIAAGRAAGVCSSAWWLILPVNAVFPLVQAGLKACWLDRHASCIDGWEASKLLN